MNIAFISQIYNGAWQFFISSMMLDLKVGQKRDKTAKHFSSSLSQHVLLFSFPACLVFASCICLGAYLCNFLPCTFYLPTALSFSVSQMLILLLIQTKLLFDLLRIFSMKGT